MKTKIIEVTNHPEGINHGKFMLGRFEEHEWAFASAIEGPGFMHRRWGPDHLLVLDLETCEGAIFLHGGYAKADLEKHRVWVCPMFEPFLNWLYKQDISDLDALPPVVTFTEAEAPSSMAGYRRSGRES